MAADLTTIYDHPANVLESTETADVLMKRSGGFMVAASRLRTYEIDKGVTFAALDNDGLAQVREAYRTLCEYPSDRNHVQRSLDLANAVRDLLGLDDA